MGLSHSPQIVTDGLIFCLDAGNKRSYPGSGTTWTNLILNNNPAFINNPTFSSANLGSFYLNGSNHFIHPTYNLGNEFSFLSWVNIPDVYNIQTIFANVQAGTGTNGFKIFVNSYNTSNRAVLLEIGNGSSGFTVITNTGIISPNTWYQIGFTANKNNSTLKIYVNGVNLASGTSGINYNTNAQLYLGYMITQYPMQGNISNYSIYNRALTQQEVSQNFNALRGRYGI